MSRWWRSVCLSLICVVCSVGCSEEWGFPEGFRFGAATAAYQIEGAWNVSDKGVSIWDTLVHVSPSLVSRGATGDTACDSYHLWREDVRIAAELGLHFYRFSISWPRVLPTGLPNSVSEDGVRYYNNLINELISNGIEPVITMYHWDLPQRLQDLGGWTNPLVVEWFSWYARVLYSRFGDRVRTWVTVNEPLVVCGLGYSSGVWAPRVTDPDVAYYLCAKHVLLAHATAYRVYEREYKNQYHGKVGYANHVIWLEPATPHDEETTELLRQHLIGMFAHPVFSSGGGWPPAVEAHMRALSLREGYSRSRLPAFTQHEVDIIKGSSDFFAVQHYTSRLVRPSRPGDPVPSWPLTGSPEYNVTFTTGDHWERTSSDWLYVYPVGMRRTLVWISEKYGNPDIIITENGFASDDPGLDDPGRVDYYRRYMEQMLLAMREDGVKVVAYTAWSLMDNFEWTDGYSSKFGLYAVDFESANKTRQPRRSAKFYAKVIKHRTLDVDGYHDEF